MKKSPNLLGQLKKINKLIWWKLTLNKLPLIKNLLI